MRIGVAGDLRLDGPDLYENRFDGPYAQAKWGDKQSTIGTEDWSSRCPRVMRRRGLRYGDGITR